MTKYITRNIIKKMKITSENAEYQVIKSLKTNRVKRNKLQEIFIEGTECIKQAIKANMEITRMIIQDKSNLSGWGKDVIESNKNAELISMSDKLYSGLSDKNNPSEMLITCKMKQYKTSDIKTENPFFIVFDRPSDFGNFGSIIRSANMFNIDAIFIMGHGVDIYEPKVIRSSLGSVFFTKIILLESMEKLADFIKSQKEINSMEVIGTDSEGAVSLNNIKIKRPVMLILGNEAKGMSVKLKEICDKTVSIPINGNVNSLNVSCAASILMWEIFKGSHE